MKYAVLDWDNTVRRGFTLFDWMDYLFDENIIDRKVNREIEEVQLKYAEKAISHDDYARKACMIYARAMNGVSALLRDQLVQNYIDRDIKQLQPFSRGIFSFLNKHGIRPIIISGAPEYVLKQYKDEFKLFKIYAFAERVEGGRCSGEVEYNYGVRKDRIIRFLREKYGNKPLIGFGDSYSDIPLLSCSEYGICIVRHGNDAEQVFGRGIYQISDDISNSQMNNFLEQNIHLRNTKQSKHILQVISTSSSFQKRHIKTRKLRQKRPGGEHVFLEHNSYYGKKNES